MKDLEAALAKFMKASEAARQRRSDAVWAELLELKDTDPTVTIDDIIALHNDLVASLDSMAQPFPGLLQQVQEGHRSLTDVLLDLYNKRDQK